MDEKIEEIIIVCKHFDISTRCNSPNMKKTLGYFRKKCTIWHKLEDCGILERIEVRKNE